MLAPFRAWRALILVLASAAAGLAWNAGSGRGFPLLANAMIQEGDVMVDAAEARRRHDKGSALFLDARPFANYEMEHIPGALSLPFEEFDAAFARLEPRLRESLDVVVYCSGYGCEASHDVARLLKARGVPAVVLQDGWPAWTDAGGAARTGKEP